MTEKRFKMKKRFKRKEYAIYEEGNPICMTLRDANNRLNELWEENKQLEEDYDYLEKQFKEEKWYSDNIDEDRDAWRHKCQELEKENEQLKLEIQQLKNQK